MAVYKAVKITLDTEIQGQTYQKTLSTVRTNILQIAKRLKKFLAVIGLNVLVLRSQVE